MSGLDGQREGSPRGSRADDATPAERAVLALRLLGDVLDAVPPEAVAAVTGLDDAATGAVLADLERDGALRHVDGGVVLAPAARTEQPPDARHPLVRSTVAWLATAHAGEPLLAARMAFGLPIAGDPQVAAALVDGARSALDALGADVALELLDRAEAEPLPPALRGRVLLVRALAARALSQPAEAEELARAACAREDDHDAVADAAGLLAQLLLEQGRELEAVAALERSADLIADVDDPRRVALERRILSLASNGAYAHGAALRRARRLAGRPGVAGGALAVAVAEALIPIDGTAAEVRDRLEPVAEDLDVRDPAGLQRAIGLATTLLRAERWDGAEHLLARIVGATAPGSPEHRLALALRGYRLLAVGTPRAALPLAETAIGEVGDARSRIASTIAAATAARATAATGDPEAGLALLARIGVAAGGAPPEGAGRSSVAIARAEVLLAAGDDEGALRDALAVREQRRPLDPQNPSGFPWALVACRVLAARGERTRAARIAKDAVDAATRWGSPMAVSRALRARACASQGDDRVRVLRIAQRRVEATPLCLERVLVLEELARALAAVGRGGEAARLDAAIETARAAAFPPRTVAAAGAGAAAVTGPAAAARPAVATGLAARLTPRQQDVALGLARGATNDQIAGDLGISARTVQSHVAAILRVTGTKRRTEAAMRLDDELRP